MKLEQLTVKEFSVFEDVAMEFSPGLNVLIGENATGQSHIMKLLYSTLTALAPPSAQRKHESPHARLKGKLAAVFMPDNGELGRLVRRPGGRKPAGVSVRVDDDWTRFSLTPRGDLRTTATQIPLGPATIFIPSREVLTMYEGFLAAYQQRELSFDETYYDLCIALSARPLRDGRGAAGAKLIRPLRAILGGAVELKAGRFHVQSEHGVVEAHLLAEGHRKIAGIVHLIGNGSLAKNGILFWDEPEANLNPKLITRVAEVLRSLADGGVQVFAATHDYLLSHELSLAVEYNTKPVVPTRFFAFGRENAEDAVTVDAGDTLADLECNPILEEFGAHYDREHALFAKEAGA